MMVIIGVILFTPLYIYSIEENNDKAEALKYADEGQTPAGYYDVDKGFIGYVIKADLDGKDGDELIIPYCNEVNKVLPASEDNPNEYKKYYYLSVCIVIENHKQVVFSSADKYNPTKCQSLYMTVRNVIKGKLPVLFMSVNGWEGSNGMTSIYFYNIGLLESEKQPNPENVVFSRSKMRSHLQSMLLSWDLVFHQFDTNIFTYNSFLRDGPYVLFDVEGLTVNARGLQSKIDKEKLTKFKEKVDSYYKKRRNGK